MTTADESSSLHFPRRGSFFLLMVRENEKAPHQTVEGLTTIPRVCKTHLPKIDGTLFFFGGDDGVVRSDGGGR